MRIRLPFAGVFFVLLVIAGYAGLTSLQLGGIVNDKLLHAVTFFLLTVVFYWIVDTNRRRTLNMSLIVCTGGLGIGSELLQAAIPNNGRVFDVLDIAANVIGSLAGLGLCSWYHKRMLERKRQRKYTAVPGEEGDDDETHPADVELGEGIGASTHADDDGTTLATTTTSTLPSGTTAASASSAAPTLQEEVDNWDENAPDDAWDEADGDIGGAVVEGVGKTKKAD